MSGKKRYFTSQGIEFYKYLSSAVFCVIYVLEFRALLFQNSLHAFWDDIYDTRLRFQDSGRERVSHWTDVSRLILFYYAKAS
jgi:hypothetical protein